MRHLIAPSSMLEVAPTSIDSSSQKGMRTHHQSLSRSRRDTPSVKPACKDGAACWGAASRSRSSAEHPKIERGCPQLRRRSRVAIAVAGLIIAKPPPPVQALVCRFIFDSSCAAFMANNC
jgi:hypothetical protein